MLLQAVTETIGAEGSSVWMQEDGPAGGLVCRAAYHYASRRSPVNNRLRPGQGIAGWVVQEGESVVIAFVRDDPRFFPDIDDEIGLRTNSMLAAPLRVRGSVIGVLEVINKRNGAFNAQDRALVETLAASAAIAIDNARLVEALRQQTLELQARNAELDAFAHTVAHDLKTPLGPIIGLSELLTNFYHKMSEADLKEGLTSIARSGRKMNNIINELLLLAQMHEADIEFEALDMAGILAEVKDRLSYMIDEYQADICLPPAWPVALGYGPWVEEVWSNYLSNALKYGGRPPQIQLGANDEAGGMIRFWIQDNGAGLSPEEQAQLFAPFTQVGSTRVQGHGLGLSIVRRIVERLGGKVGVESKGVSGQGSVFFFTLPALPGAPISLPQPEKMLAL
jgi:signal transduction histidine kinase